MAGPRVIGVNLGSGDPHCYFKVLVHWTKNWIRDMNSDRNLDILLSELFPELRD